MSHDLVFYENRCPHCGSFDVREVAHAAEGWSTLFKSYPPNPDQPGSEVIMSREDWREYFRWKPTGTLVDSYGKFHDALEWVDQQRPPDLEQQRWENSSLGERLPQRDPEGFRIEPGSMR